MSNPKRKSARREARSAPPQGSADRVIIGESIQAGWPISAKVYQPDGNGDFGMPPMRWVKRPDSTFALECYVFGQSKWVEVPLWDTPPNLPMITKNTLTLEQPATPPLPTPAASEAMLELPNDTKIRFCNVFGQIKAHCILCKDCDIYLRWGDGDLCSTGKAMIALEMC